MIILTSRAQMHTARTGSSCVGRGLPFGRCIRVVFRFRERLSCNGLLGFVSAGPGGTRRSHATADTKLLNTTEPNRRIHTVSATSSDLGGCCAEWSSSF